MLFTFALAACTANESDCDQDNDCQADFYCATNSGGIIFSGGICLKKSDASKNDLLDVNIVFEIGDSEPDDTNIFTDISDSEIADTQDQTDTDDKDSSQEQPNLECARDEECGQTVEQSAWTNCDGFADSCSLDGTQTRQVRAPRCESGFCSLKTITQQRECQRDTNGNICGTVSELAWSECSFDGFKSRELRTPTCGNGTCSPDITTETLPCNCTANRSCGEVTKGIWGPCSFENTCDSSGTREREVRTPTCTANSCTIVTTIESDRCSRTQTDGIICGQASSTDWTNCANQNPCATSGQQTKQTHTPTCQDDQCVILSKTDTQNCPISAPQDCGQPSYTEWSTCEYPNTCASQGTKTRTKTTPTCQNQSCNAIKTTETDSCSRQMPTGSCGTPTYSDWSDCVFQKPCDNKGTKTRTKTTPTCQNQSCDTVKTTESDSCSRSTPTGSCGSPTYTNWSTCKYPTTCSQTATQTRTKNTPTCQNLTCTSVPITEIKNCDSRNTNGQACGEPTSSEWSQCIYQDTCSQLAPPMTRTTTTPVCSNETCSDSLVTTESSPCILRNTKGQYCDNGYNSGACDSNGCCTAACPPYTPCELCAIE